MTAPARPMLAALVGPRRRFGAVVGRVGRDDQGRDTLLLTEVTGDSGELLVDHCWLLPGPDTEALRPHLGRRVRFTATVRVYGRLDGATSYSLEGVAHVSK